MMNVYFDMIVVFFKKAWTFVKSYWSVGAILALILVAGVLFKDTSSVEKQYQEKLEQQKSYYESEMRIIQTASDQKLAEKERIEEEFNKTLSKLEYNYAVKQTDLQKWQKNRVKEIVKTNLDNPDRRVKQIAIEMGFQEVTK